MMVEEVDGFSFMSAFKILWFGSC